MLNSHSTITLILIISDPCELTASQVYMPASFRVNFVIFNIGPSDTIRSSPPDKMGKPSLVHVYAIDMGFALAIMATCNCSPSTPTTVDDGGGMNFGGSVCQYMK